MTATAGRLGNPKLIENKRKKFDAAKLRIRSRAGDKRYELLYKRTNRHVYLVIIDNAQKREIARVSTANLDGKPFVSKEIAMSIASLFTTRATELGIEKDDLYINRGSNRYHGVLAAIVDALRENDFKI